MRLIDADALKDQIEPYRYAICGFEGILALIDNAKTVEFSKEICSACGRYIREKGGAE